MAGIWADIDSSMSNIIENNKTESLVFSWLYVTFSNEQQEAAEVRWRKAGTFSSIHQRIYYQENSWTGFASVGRHPTDSNIESIYIPVGTLSDGIWYFQVRQKTVGVADWSGWTTHRIEIDEYGDHSVSDGTALSVIRAPVWPTEGTYGTSVRVMSEAGILSAWSPDAQYDVWDTNKFVKLANGDVVPVPENRMEGTLVGRVMRPV